MGPQGVSGQVGTPEEGFVSVFFSFRRDIFLDPKNPPLPHAAFQHTALEVPQFLNVLYGNTSLKRVEVDDVALGDSHLAWGRLFIFAS